LPASSVDRDALLDAGSKIPTGGDLVTVERFPVLVSSDDPPTDRYGTLDAAYFN
jgi:hypothetical protein